MRKIWILAAVVPLFAVAGCATRGSVDLLRQEIAGVRQTANAADQKATEALSTAQKAEADASKAQQDAQMAGEKADRIFREGLRK